MESFEMQDQDDHGKLDSVFRDVNNMSAIIGDPTIRKFESTEYLNLSLHQSARDGDEEAVRRLLSSYSQNRKKKVNLKDDEALSALHYAARYNHLVIVQMLIQSEADPNCVDDDGATPLHFAARYKRMRFTQDDTDESNNQMTQDTELTPDNSVILYLVQQGCRVNKEDNYGCTALHFAAMRGNEVATKELLSCADVQIEAVDKQKMTALHMAASHNEIEIVRMLIAEKAMLRCTDEEQATPLHYACMEGGVEVVKLLFEQCEMDNLYPTVPQMVSDQDNQKNTALHLAVENRSLEVAELLIERDANVNAVRSNYQTPLHLAAIAGDISICKLLVQHGARVNVLDGNQETPLYKAAAHDQHELVEFFLEEGSNINKHDKDGFSPLLIAACKGHAPTVKTLLSKGANILDTDKNDKSALFWAAEEDNVDVMKVLLSQDEDVAGIRKSEKIVKYLLDVTDKYDNTALHVAAEKGYINSVKVLLDFDADLDAKNDEEQTALHLAARYGKTIVVRELVRRDKMTINDEDEDSNTALHLAALSGHNKVAQALLDAGADIEARNATLWTPLDCAAAKGFHKTVKVLLESDSPVDPVDKTKTTPLLLASKNGHVEVVKLLIQWNANVSQEDDESNNCLDLAITKGHKDVAEAIVHSKKWREALSNETEKMVNNKKIRETPLRKLIKKMPDVAEIVFNKCTTDNKVNQDDPKYQITFNFEFLDDMYANWNIGDSSDALSSVDSIYDEDNHVKVKATPYTTDKTVLKENHPLMIMVKANQEDLLAHPLVTCLLHHKWSSFGRYVYYINFTVYCIFLAFLTGYLLSTDAPFHEYYNRTNAQGGLSECEDIRDLAYAGDVEQPWFAAIAKYVIMGLSALYIVRELFQMYNAKWNYFGWENAIEWVTYITALLLVIDFSQCQQDTGIRLGWQWQLGAVSIFLAWMDLVLFIRKFPKFGIYVVMFTVILSTFIQFLPVFLLFVVAFALSFFVLMQNQYQFRNPGHSLIKTSVMMIGEFDFADIFLGLDGIDEKDSPDAHKSKIYYSAVSYIIFICFLIIMSILIMNLLVGLAVDDIKAVQEQAILQRMAMQVELALDVESVLPHFIRRKFVVKCLVIKPNQSSGFLKRLTGVKSLSSDAISKALDPELDDMEELKENQDQMKRQIYNLRQKIKTMASEQENVKTMLSALLKHHNISIEEEDAQDDEQ